LEVYAVAVGLFFEVEILMHHVWIMLRHCNYVGDEVGQALLFV
jgi:hypothetical protein